MTSHTERKTVEVTLDLTLEVEYVWHRAQRGGRDSDGRQYESDEPEGVEVGRVLMRRDYPGDPPINFNIKEFLSDNQLEKIAQAVMEEE